ncbi:MAG: ectonucleotide pyrophosphatase/phosphodiesterase [Streptococcaceae bacterium]|jgi:predicted AlkP superfamily pyrophosphatase or phosphodiesterase|nr:ectonucleotide pyrophosphatase/phosphodiesterase [Streptococcaceae bacterium]
MPLLVISFDAVGDQAFEKMTETYPVLKKFKENSYYKNQVETIFISNTYPIHTTVSTGKLPKDHGIISNYLAPNKRNPRPWAQEEKYIKCKTIWQAAKEKGITTAAFLWPVTGGAKIDYHLPEGHVNPGQSQAMLNLRLGSKWLQINALRKHGKLLDGIKQPNLDNFTTSVVVDLLSKKTPDLVLVHLIAYDDIAHSVGIDDERLEVAKKALNDNLGKLLNVWSGDVLVFSDHSQLNIKETINLESSYPGKFDHQGGSVFTDEEIDFSNRRWFARMLTKEEMHESGWDQKYKYGIAAKPGYTFSDEEKRGDHGYPLDVPNYHTFYAINKQIDYTDKLQGKITDVTAIIAKELGLEMDIINDLGL